MEETRCGWHSHQRRHLRSAARLAIDHHPVRIAAEVLDVLTHPSQSRDQVRHAYIRRVLVCRSAYSGHIQEAQHVQSMIYRNLNYVMVPGHLGPIMRRQLIGGAKAETTAMQVHHDRTLPAQARRPDIQLQHVFALPSVIPVEQKSLLNAGPGMQRLWTIGSVG